MDVIGAFSDVTFDSLIDGMIQNRVNAICSRLIRHMLTNRYATTSFNGVKRSIVVKIRCPQESVRSPFLWSIVKEEILTLLARKFSQIYSHGYTDDLGLIAKGMDDSTVTNLMQRVINAVKKWCIGKDLPVNDKMVIIVFTRRIKFNTVLFYLIGKQLAINNEVKYLGVTMDRQLTWCPHSRARTTLVRVKS